MELNNEYKAVGMELSNKYKIVEMGLSNKDNDGDLKPGNNRNVVEIEPSNKHNAVGMELSNEQIVVGMELNNKKDVEGMKPSNKHNVVEMKPSDDQQRVQHAVVEPTRSQPTAPPPDDEVEDKDTPEQIENTKPLKAQEPQAPNPDSRDYFKQKYKEAWRSWDKRTRLCVREGVQWLNFIQHVCKKETDIQRCLLERQQTPGPKSERTQQMEEVLGNLCSVEENLLEALDHAGPFVDFLDQAPRRLLKMATLSWKMKHGDKSRGKEDNEGRGNTREETVPNVENVPEGRECETSQEAVTGRCSPVQPES